MVYTRVVSYPAAPTHSFTGAWARAWLLPHTMSLSGIQVGTGLQASAGPPWPSTLTGRAS